MKECNIIYKDNEAFEILTQINSSLFRNKNGEINEQVLGMYVHNYNANKVLQKNGKFLICKKIDEAKIL